MKLFEMKSFGDDARLAKAVARDWLEFLKMAPRPHLVALSGGKISTPFFAAIAKGAKGKPGLMKGVHFFWADERCVPPDDEESNFRLAQENIFKPLKIPAAQIHRLKGELPPAKAIAEAIAEIEKVAPENGKGIPVLDIIFLGIGPNGHTASLMPNAKPAVKNSRKPYAYVDNSPKPPPQRLTMTYPVMAAAKNIWMLAAGEGKEKALKDSISPKGKTPFGAVLASRPFTRIYSSIAV